MPTGRFRSRPTEFWRVPPRTEEGSQLRKIFRYVPKDLIFVDLDFSAIEIRIWASLVKKDA